MGVLDTLLGRQSDPVEAYDWSISDPALAEVMAGWLGINQTGLPAVSEYDAMGLTAFSRAVELIAGTIAGLPLKAYEESGETRRDVLSFLDQPQGPYAISAYQWVEMVVIHLVVYREAFLLHVYNGAGILVGFWPVHPDAVAKVEWVGPRKRFMVTDGNGEQKAYDDTQMTQVMGPNAYGTRGVPLYRSHRRVFQTAIAGEQAAARSFTGALIAGLVTTIADDDMDEGEAKVIKESLNAKLMGPDHASDIAFVNRELKFTPWTMSNADAQFIESRQHEVEEFARMTGVPPHLLAAIEKQTSWGTGVAEQNIGLARYCLMSYTSRLEAALSPLLPDGQFAEFDYKGFLQGSPADEIKLLLEQVKGGLLTADEARAIMNRPPLPAQPAPAAAALPQGDRPNG